MAEIATKNVGDDIFVEEYTLFILDSKSTVCMANNGKYTKHTRHITKNYIW